MRFLAKEHGNGEIVAPDVRSVVSEAAKRGDYPDFRQKTMGQFVVAEIA